jgi:hypothetical protein
MESTQMDRVFDSPLLIFVVSFTVLWLAARLGYSLLRRRLGLEEDAREHFGVILGATLTLLVLLIGFTFSMAIGRYDQRKDYEDAEATAISAELVRAGLLPPGDAASVRALLGKYLDQRIAFYLAPDEQQLHAIDAHTAKLRNDLWSAVQAPAAAQPNPLIAQIVPGLVDVFKAQEHTQAAWWNRIPHAAWGLMGVIAICSNLLVGYGARHTKGGEFLLLVLPLIVAVAFLLIADIDSPRGGLIHVSPLDLQSLSESLPAQ